MCIYINFKQIDLHLYISVELIHLKKIIYIDIKSNLYKSLPTLTISIYLLLIKNPFIDEHLDFKLKKKEQETAHPKCCRHPRCREFQFASCSAKNRILPQAQRLSSPNSPTSRTQQNAKSQALARARDAVTGFRLLLFFELEIEVATPNMTSPPAYSNSKLTRVRAWSRLEHPNPTTTAKPPPHRDV